MHIVANVSTYFACVLFFLILLYCVDSCFVVFWGCVFRIVFVLIVCFCSCCLFGVCVFVSWCLFCVGVCLFELSSLLLCFVVVNVGLLCLLCVCVNVCLLLLLL